jgi:glutamine cyclotransferase
LKNKTKYYLLCVIVSLIGCKENNTSKTEEEKVKSTLNLNYNVLGYYPHDILSFTEGLFIHENKLYESTGSPDPAMKSVVGIMDTITGKIDVKISIDGSQYFGEGITILNAKLYQLTYRSQKCLVYDVNSFKKIGTFNYSNLEGWGLTNDGTHLIMSDGTFKISYLNPEDFTVIKTLNITENGYGKENINELEYVDGFIYANVWMTNDILKIDAANGKVVSKANFNALSQESKVSNPKSLEMNGIAYDATTETFLLTGKFWPKVYRVRLR